ncbi:MAG: hypothetical protein ACRCWQ_08575 [Bacilli bacterium]
MEIIIGNVQISSISNGSTLNNGENIILYQRSQVHSNENVTVLEGDGNVMNASLHILYDNDWIDTGNFKR